MTRYIHLLLLLVASNAYVVRRRDPFDNQESMRDALEALERRRVGERYLDAAQQRDLYEDAFQSDDGYEDADPYLLQNLLDQTQLRGDGRNYDGDEELGQYSPYAASSFSDGGLSQVDSDRLVGVDRGGSSQEEPVTREELESIFKSINDQDLDLNQEQDRAPSTLSLKKKYQPALEQFKNPNSLSGVKSSLKNLNPQQMQTLLDNLRASKSDDDKRNVAKKSHSEDDTLQRVNQEELNAIFGPAGIKKGNTKKSIKKMDNMEEMTKKRKRSGSEGVKDSKQDVGNSDVIGDTDTHSIPLYSRGDLDYRTLYHQTDLKAELLQRENEYLTNALDLATLSQLKGGNDLIPKEAENLQKAMEVESLIGRLERQMVQHIGAETHSSEESREKEETANKRDNVDDLAEQGYLKGVEDKKESESDDSYVVDDEEQFRLPRPIVDEDENVVYLPDAPLYTDQTQTCPVVEKVANGCQILQDAGVVLDREAAALCDRHLVCYACGATVGGSRDSCDQGFLVAAERACRDDEDCKDGATSVLVALQKLHAFNVNKINACRTPCVMDFVVNGIY